MLVIADDLTGAADTAGAFAVAGHRCVVVLHHARKGTHAVLELGEEDDPAGIRIFDTDGRAMRQADACGATTEIVRHSHSAELFIKIDSTLRGHVRATVEAALAGMRTPPARIVVCPAFPSHGRSVVDGHVRVDGIAIDAPSLYELFAEVAGEIPVLIPDALDDCDLSNIVATETTSNEFPGPTLWVGSAGIARHLGTRTLVAAPAITLPLPARRVVVVAGSQHARTSEQLTRLDPGTETILLDPRDAAFRDIAQEAILAADGLVLTGGATARAVLDALHIDTLNIGGEVESGVPWSTAVGASGAIGVVTKAGGFGTPLTLQRAVRFLRRPE